MLTSARIIVLALLCLVVLSSPSAAQVDTEGSGVANINYFDFFVVKGGPIGFGLIILSVVTLALTIEHCVSIRRATIVPPEALAQAKELIEKRNYLEAVKLTAQNPSMLAHVLHAAMTEASHGFEAMERAMAETLEDRSARLFRKTEFIHIIGNVSPMIGLFGTVTGMILLFAEIHAADAFPGARIVADRIAISLITTFWGLAVAIPALSIHAMFRNRIDVLTAECALAADEVLRLFRPGGGGSTSAAPAAASPPPAPPPSPSPPSATS